jgi:acetoin utilization deacetylase AcuC-like enzyme
MEKYRLLRARIAGDFDIELAVPDPATDEMLRRVHTGDYVSSVRSGRLSRERIRRMGFPWSPQLVERSRRSVGGTVLAARSALAWGVSVNLAGGTHHAFADHGDGYCVFNDVAVAIRDLQAHGEADRCAVVDLDVHQGDGTAALFRDDPDVLTVSVHGAGNYPFQKESSDLDIALPDGAGDDAFLRAVEISVRRALDHDPDLVFFVAGADPFTGDRLGRLAVTKRGLLERDALVFELCERDGVPVAVVMAGGYAHDIEDTVDIHVATVRAATRSARRREAARTTDAVV